MSGPLGSSQWMYKTGPDYTIDQSLRFNDNYSDYLSWTPTQATDETYTMSMWFKYGLDGGTARLWYSGVTNANGWLTITSDGYMDFYNFNSPSANAGIRLDMQFRDVSAWYHLVIQVTDVTLANRATAINVWVNGVEQSFALADYNTPTDTDRFIDTTTKFLATGDDTTDGTGARTLADFWDGYLAEINFIDGTAVDASSFGSFGAYGEWKPKKYTGSYGTNGFYLTFASGGILAATGGDSITTDGDYKVHSFTSTGNSTFTVTSIPETEAIVEYLVIAGGGAGAADGSTTAGNGAGGAGGYRTGVLTVTDQAYTVTVGAGGVGATTANAVTGGDSVFSSITSAGGGGGGYYTSTPGEAGGSGGGGAPPSASGGAASPAGQGYAGEAGSSNQGGGGGGAAEAGGTDGTGQGGDGLTSSITGTAVTRAGGGGGSRASGGARAGGDGGGGAGGNGGAGTSGTANTGGGGGGGVSGGASGSGGSGIVIIRYKFQ